MISLFTHYSGLREYVGTEKDRPPFDVPNGSKFSQMDGKTLDTTNVDVYTIVPYVGNDYSYELFF